MDLDRRLEERRGDWLYPLEIDCYTLDPDRWGTVLLPVESALTINENMNIRADKMAVTTRNQCRRACTWLRR